MNNFSIIRTLNLMLKSYEIFYIFCDPLPPSYETLSHIGNVDNSGRPLTFVFLFSVNMSMKRAGRNHKIYITHGVMNYLLTERVA